MGGKTQQRVAGNAKPAKSGRIRELLVNQQMGTRPTGNIITFSALSNKKQPTKPNESESVAKDSEDNVDLQEPNIEQTRDSFEVTKEIASTPIKENYKLLVKRVGNRDFYTRVKVSEQKGNNEGLIEPDVSPSDAGVKKPTYSLESTIIPKNEPNEPPTQSDAEEEEEVSDDQESEIESGDEVEGDFDELVERLARVREEDLTINADTLGEANERQLEKEVEFLKLLKTLVERFSQDLSIEDWDLLSHSLYKWIGWISKAEHPLRETFQSNFSVKVFKFIYDLTSFAENLKCQDNNSSEYPMLQSLLDDWANFHSSSMFQELIVLYFKLIALESRCEQSCNIIRPMIEALAHIIVRVDSRLVLSHQSLLDNFNSNVELDPDFKAPESSIFCRIDEKKFKGFLAVCGLMRSNYRVILVSAHSMLSKTLVSICENALQVLTPAQQDQQDEIIDEEIPIFPPMALMSTLTSRDALMSTLLSDYRVGDTSVTIEHNTDAYGCTLSYLFAWDFVIQFIVGVDKAIGHKIIHSLKKLGLIQRLLDNIFMLLPPLGQQDSLRFRIYKSAPSKYKHLIVATSQLAEHPWNLENFLKSPLRTTVKRPLNEIELIALHLYFSVALHMPVTVRKWYNNNSNKRLCNLVNEYTVKHISRVICSLEMESVQEKCLERATNQMESTNLTIKARPSAKEVYAIYNRDEFKMELTIKLPLNYPLGPVQIDGGKRVGVTDVKWRSWLLQLTTFLAHQNGPILDGIDLWRKNIDKRFEGVEKCTICFSILHSNYQLPKKRCQTCSNMFHNLCLFKWFESSGNSTCPLCRNPW